MKLPIYTRPERNEWQALLQRPTFDFLQLNEMVATVLNDVQLNGDEALKRFTFQYDKVDLSDLMVTDGEFTIAGNSLSLDLKEAINTAAANIEKFHKGQLVGEVEIETMPGVKCWRKSIGIEKVGLYIPGGSAPLFSTILMLGIPAKIAGCKEVIICTPPGKDGGIHPAILYTAELVGINKVFKVGGAQAIAAMAYGTETIPKVYKIFGPGNQYVTCAKQLVQQDGLAIDMPAGPSEVAVIADKTAEPAYVAADLLSQAEHGPDSQVVLITTSVEFAEKVHVEIVHQLEGLPRKAIATEALKHSKLIVVNEMQEAIDMVNEYAPEHLIISCENDEIIAEQVFNAGSIFLGNYSPESVGDYASGTNHTLPTNGFARAYSGVSVDSFVKKITFQKLTKEGLKNIAKAVGTLAEAEGLDAHKNAVSIRLKN